MSVKEMKFKAGIDSGDLERKMKNVVKYLLKGNCQVSISTDWRRRNSNPNILTDTLDQVIDPLKEYLAVDPRDDLLNNNKKMNPRFINVMLQPKKNIHQLVKQDETELK